MRIVETDWRPPFLLKELLSQVYPNYVTSRRHKMKRYLVVCQDTLYSLLDKGHFETVPIIMTG